MKAEEQILIDSSIDELCRTLRCGMQFLSILQSKYQLTDDELELIRRQSTSSGKTHECLSILKTRRNGFEDLLYALKQTRQSVAFDLLNEKLNRTLKPRFLQTIVQFQNTSLKLRDLSSFFQTLCPVLSEKLDNFIDQHLSVNPPDNPISIVSLNIPYGPPAYYIERTLTRNRNISHTILRLAKLQTCKEVFVVQGMELFDLTTLTRVYGCDAASSSSQFRRKAISNRIILLEKDQSFEGLCKLPVKLPAQPVNIHLFDLIDKSSGEKISPESNVTETYLQWVRSFGTVECFSNYVIADGSEEVKEMDLMLRDNFGSSRHICISNGTGMGKTLLLINSALKISHLGRGNSLRFVLYAIVPRFYAELENGERVSSSGRICTEDTISALAKCVCKVETEYPIIHALLQTHLQSSRTIMTDVMFDGLDEIPHNSALNVLEAIHQLTAMQNIRIWISTRPKYQSLVETILGTLHWSLSPFSRDESVTLIRKYWTEESWPKVATRNNEHMRNQADILLEAIQNKLSIEEPVTNIPQFAVLAAKVCADDIRMSRTDDRFTKISSVSGLQVADIYRRFIELSFKNGDRDKLTLLHMKICLQLKFPEVATYCASYFDTVDAMSTDNISAFGLLLQTNPPTVIHKTFMDYFIALFINNLYEDVMHSRTQQSLDYLSEILTTIFQVQIDSESDSECILNKTPKKQWMQSIKFQHFSICYFLNYLLEAAVSDKAIPFSDILNNRRWWNQLVASVFHGFSVLVKLFLKSHQELCTDAERRSEMRTAYNHTEYLKVLIGAAKKTNGTLFKEVTEELESYTNINVFKIKGLNLNKTRYFGRSDLMNVAIEAGNEEVVTYLAFKFCDYGTVNASAQEFHTVKIHVSDDMLNHCVINSTDDVPSVVERKVKIFNLLISRSRVPISATKLAPLILHRMNATLLDTVLQNLLRIIEPNNTRESEVLCHVRNRYSENILHLLASGFYQHVTPEAFHSFLIKWKDLLKLPKLLKQKNCLDWTSAEVAISIMDLKEETIKVFTDNGVQLSVQDYKFSTFVYKAIAGLRSPHFLSFLLKKVQAELGSNQLRRKTFGETVLHVSAAYYHIEAIKYFVLKSKVDTNVQDDVGNTPLHILFRNANIPSHTSFFQTHIPPLFYENNSTYIKIISRANPAYQINYVISREHRNSKNNSRPIVFKIKKFHNDDLEALIYIRCTLQPIPNSIRFRLTILNQNNKRGFEPISWIAIKNASFFENWEVSVRIVNQEKGKTLRELLSQRSWLGFYVSVYKPALYYYRKLNMLPVQLVTMKDNAEESPYITLKVDPQQTHCLDVFVPWKSVKIDSTSVEDPDNLPTDEAAVFTLPFPLTPVSRRLDNPKNNEIQMNPNNQHKIAEFLVKHGARLNVPNFNGLSPLHYAKKIFYLGLKRDEIIEMEQSSPFWFLLKDQITLALKGLQNFCQRAFTIGCKSRIRG